MPCPLLSTDCERGFSTMKRIKTEKRNSLSCQNLQHLLIISIEGPTALDFPYDKAVGKWAAEKKRRLATNWTINVMCREMCCVVRRLVLLNMNSGKWLKCYWYMHLLPYYFHIDYILDCPGQIQSWTVVEFLSSWYFC